jgi:protein-tyrosine kinase
MSRVDQAMQRAAAEEPVDTMPVAGTIPESAFPAEAFPDEAPAPAPTLKSAPAPAAEAPPEPGATERPAGDPKDTRAPQPIAGTVFDRMDARLTEKVVVDARISAVSREQYRRLAAILHDAQNTTGLRVVMVASALTGEGKTLTASNLALTFSESYQRRVLLVDADLRRPSLDALFRLNSATGLSDGLASDASRLVVRQVSSRLAVLPAGRPNADPMAGLTSERMRHLLAEAREAFDWVFVDTPPLGLMPDAHILASMVDGVVVVVRAGSTPHASIKRAVDAIGRTRILGVVLNGSDPTPASGYYGYDYDGRTRERTLVRT